MLRQESVSVKYMASGAGLLRLESRSAVYELSDLEKAAYPFCASIFHLLKKGYS